MSGPAHLSPNFGNRREDARPTLVVLHYTGMATHDAALARLCDPAAEVSAHYLIGIDGTVVVVVDEAQRAWHAGAGAWGRITDVNSNSIGIELANPGDCPFPERQMAALETTLAGAMSRWSILPQRVIAHSDMAPMRKRDPGPRFDWRRLALEGLSIWPDTTAVTSARPFLEAARIFGYPDVPERDVLNAFRLRFRPWAQGPVDQVDAAMANDLATRFG